LVYGTYKDDKYDGTYQSYYENGDPLCTIEYDMGEMISEECQ